MKIKGSGCVSLYQGFNPNESKFQKPCGGGRRECGARDKHGGCGNSPQVSGESPLLTINPPSECNCNVYNQIIEYNVNGSTMAYNIIENSSGKITATSTTTSAREVRLKIEVGFPTPLLGEIYFSGSSNREIIKFNNLTITNNGGFSFTDANLVGVRLGLVSPSHFIWNGKYIIRYDTINNVLKWGIFYEIKDRKSVV